MRRDVSGSLKLDYLPYLRKQDREQDIARRLLALTGLFRVAMLSCIAVIRRTVPYSRRLQLIRPSLVGHASKRAAVTAVAHSTNSFRFLGIALQTHGSLSPR